MDVERWGGFGVTNGRTNTPFRKESFQLRCARFLVDSHDEGSARLSLNAAVSDPCDEALPFSQEPSRWGTISSFDFGGE